MKSKKLSHAALMGITSAMFIAGGTSTLFADSCASTCPYSANTSNQIQLSPDEQHFYNKLNKEGKETYMKLTPQEREVTMKTFKEGCNGKNSCKGLGGCKTEHHACKGHNSCKGRGGEPVKDPNELVHMAHKAQK